MNFLEEVEKGRKGVYVGLNCGLPRFGKFINNISKAMYYVIGALQKTGKTAVLDHMFIISPYLEDIPKGAKINWIYFSYEVDLLEKMAKFCAYFMYIKHGILCDSNQILSRGDNKVKDSWLSKIKDIYANELLDLFGEFNNEGKCIKKGRVDFREARENPTGIHHYLYKYAEQHGTFLKEAYTINGEIKQSVVGYRENDPELYTIIIIDHIGLLKKERGFDKKANIDKMSEYLVFFRNICKFTPIVLSQFNRSLSKIDRLKFSGEELQPTLEDFKDTGNLGEDASMIIALFNPFVYTHIDNHLGYNIKKLGNSYRSIHVLASRNTESGVNLSLMMNGKNGWFKELPKAGEMTDALYVSIKNKITNG